MLVNRISPQGVIAVVENESQIAPLIGGGSRLAKARGETLTALVVNETEDWPEWLKAEWKQLDS